MRNWLKNRLIFGVLKVILEVIWYEVWISKVNGLWLILEGFDVIVGWIWSEFGVSFYRSNLYL